MELQEFYDIVGGDYDKALLNMRSEDVIKHFVGRFDTDKYFEDLIKALEKQDYSLSISITAILRDLAQTLYITSFVDICDRLISSLKAKREEYQQVFWELKTSYLLITRCVPALNCERREYSDFTYEFRTSMNTIIGFATLLEQDFRNEGKVLTYSHKIQKTGKQLLDLVHMISDKAKLDNKQMLLELIPFHLENYFDIIMNGYVEMMKHKGISIECDLQVKHTEVICDAAKLRDLGSTLLVSAVLFTPREGQITLTVKELESENGREAEYQFIFTDTGLGFSEEQITSFYETDDIDQNLLESGMREQQLRMYMVKSLVDFLGGTFVIESEQGVGTTVVVSFKLSFVDRSGRVKRPEPSKQEDCFAGKRVLLAEDNELNAQVAEEILEELGFEIEKVYDGAECVSRMQMAKEDEFDLIVMDIRMPVLDGYEAARRVRRLDGYKSQIPIIAMTADAFSEDKMEAMNAGMNGHLTKPIDPSRMIGILKGVMTKCRP